jgi:hypothetical protein
MTNIISQYLNDDSTKYSVVLMNAKGSTFKYKTECVEEGYVVKIVNFHTLSNAEDFAEDFILA